MGSEEVKEFAEELQKEGKLSEPTTEPEEEKTIEEPKDEKLLAEVVRLLEKVDEKIKDLANRVESLEKEPKEKFDELKSFTEALDNVDLKKLDAVALINTQHVQIPKSRVQEFLDQMRYYGVKTSFIHMVNTNGKGEQIYPEDELNEEKKEQLEYSEENKG
jgi:hypothetical protein